MYRHRKRKNRRGRIEPTKRFSDLRECVIHPGQEMATDGHGRFPYCPQCFENHYSTPREKEPKRVVVMNRTRPARAQPE